MKVALLLAVVAVVVTSSNVGATPRFSEWSTPVILGPAVNSPFSDHGVTVSRDGLSLLFASTRLGGFGRIDIWASQRARTSDPWGPPVNLGPRINTGSADSVPSLSRDGHRLFFLSDRPGGFGLYDIWVSYREHVHDMFDWQAPVNLGPPINTQYIDFGVFLFENDGVGAPLLYFTSDRPGGMGATDIYVSARLPDGSFGAPEPVRELNSPYRDQRAIVRQDGLEVVFFSNRPGGLGDNDLWVATRRSVSDPWGRPVNLGAPVNSASDDQQAWLAADRTTLYFTSNRPGGFGGHDLYVTTRVRATP